MIGGIRGAEFGFCVDSLGIDSSDFDPWGRIADSLDFGKPQKILQLPLRRAIRNPELESRMAENSILIPGSVLQLGALGYIFSGFATGEGDRIVVGLAAEGVLMGTMLTALLLQNPKRFIDKITRFWFDE